MRKRHMTIDPHSGTEKIRNHKYPKAEAVFFLGVEGEAEWEEDGLEIHAALIPDEEPRSLDDDEALGEFSDYAPDKPGAYIKLDPDGSEKYTLDRAGIARAYTYGEYEQYWSNSRTGTVADERAYLSKIGMSKSVAEEWARKNQRMFYERALQMLDGEITYYGVRVTASRAGVVLGESALWGIESDSGDYFDEVARECANEAISAANYRIDNLIRAGEGLPPRDEVEYITGTGRGDGTYMKVYRSGKIETFRSDV